MIVVWLSKPRAVIACAKTRKWMIPHIHNMDNFPNQRHPNTYTRIAIEILEPHNMHAVSKIKSLDNLNRLHAKIYLEKSFGRNSHLTKVNWSGTFSQLSIQLFKEQFGAASK